MDIVNEQTQSAARDPYTITADGHFQGHDGFIVPRNFAEFYDRYPTYVRRWMAQRMRGRWDSGREDRTDDLLLRLSTLPEESRYREPGTNGLPNGCRDIIEAFDPDSAYGAGSRRFFSYINFCLMHTLVNLEDEGPKMEILDPGYTKESFAKAFADEEVRDYINEYARELIPVVLAIEDCENLDNARHAFGWDPIQWARLTQRILTLYEAMGCKFETAAAA